MSQAFFDRLNKRAREIDSLLCIGLDPRVPKDIGHDDVMPYIVQENKRLIAATQAYTLAYKPNIAFYEAWGEAGLMALRSTLALIPDGIPVILDAKRGDIGATSEAYALAAFDHLGVDAITVAPYMGSDSVLPFAGFADRGVFVLTKTSNPGSADFQHMLVQHKDETGAFEPLYMHTAKTAVSWGDNIGLVMAANDQAALRAVRAVLPEVWFLAPGIGAQGGSISEAVTAGLGASGFGLLLVMARSIAQAADPEKEIATALAEFRTARDRVLDNRRLHGKSPVQNQTRTHTGEISIAGLRHELLKGLVETACFKTGDFVLKSGLRSPFYIDLRRVMSDVRVLRLAGRAYARLIHEAQEKLGIRFDRIAGIPVAALPLAAAASLETGIPMIFPRLQQKEHGTGNAIEGEFKAGERVVLLDDLITTGKSKVEALAILRQGGLVVDNLVVLIERGRAGRADMQKEGVQLFSFADVRDFIPVCTAMGVLDDAARKRVEEYLASEGSAS